MAAAVAAGPEGYAEFVAEIQGMMSRGAGELKHQREMLEDLKMEAVALRRCLSKAGLVSATEFDIERHRVRFEWFLERHPSVLEQNAVKQALLTNFAGVMVHTDGASVACLEAVSVAFRSVTAHLSRVYAIGGFDTQGKRRIGRGVEALDTVESLDILSGDWDPLQPVPVARMRAASAVAKGKLYVLGGLCGEEAMDRVDCLSMSTGVWEPCPAPMLTPRAACAAAGTGNRVYALGGSSDGKLLLSTAECYDDLSMRWSPITAMSARRGAFAAASLRGLVYALGGLNAQQKLNVFECYDPEAQRWRALPPMPQPLAELAAVAFRDRIFAIGGFGETLQPLDSVDSFHVERGVWESMPRLSQPVAACAAVVSKGRIYVLGGSNGRRTLPAVQLLVPGETFWRIGPPLRSPRMSVLAGSCLSVSWSVGRM